MNRTGTVAEEYRKIRIEGRPAQARHAFQWARDRVAAYSLYSRAESVQARRTSFCNDECADVYTLASINGRLRVEIAFLPDYEGSEPFENDDTLASLIRYFRGPYENLTRHDAYSRAVAALKARKEAEADDRERYTYGISVKVFWDTPELKDEEPIGESSCWGFIDDGSQASDEYRWASTLDQYRDALHGVRDKIRLERRAAYQAMMTEAFAANFAV